MKNKISIFSAVMCTAVLALVLILPAVPAAAQGSGFDMFGVPRTLVLTAPQTLAAASTTNGPYDTHGYLGVAKITLVGCTNAANSTVTATLQGSSDTNTWSAISYAQAVSTTATYTNSALGNVTNVYFTDTFLLPGTITTPTATTAGWATPYLSIPLFTNTGVVTLTSDKVAEVGYVIQDAPRYVRVIWTATGGATSNCIVAAVLTGRRGSEVK